MKKLVGIIFVLVLASGLALILIAPQLNKLIQDLFPSITSTMISTEKKETIESLTTLTSSSIANTKTTYTQLSTVDLEYLEKIHGSLDPKYIEELMNIIRAHPDDRIRERGIFILADIAIRSNRSEEVIDFLKQIAYEEKDDEVRTAAYVNIYLIREYYPLKLTGTLDIKVEGKVEKGKNITLIFSISSSKDVLEARTGIKKVVTIVDQRKVPLSKLLISENPMTFSLKANETKEVTFTLRLPEEDEYLIYCFLTLDLDRVDYLTIEKYVYLKAREGGGSYAVSENLEELLEEISETTETTQTT